ncbi:MAG: chromosomal replication initiator protein [Cryomorphaceae bacterium]|jgi:chromosomal replication initiator protein
MEAIQTATIQETAQRSNKAKGGEVVWSAVSEKLSGMVSSDAFDRWFSGVSRVSLTDSEFKISVPNDIHQVWIETNFMPELQNAVSEILDPMVKAIVVVHGEEDNYRDSDEDEAGGSSPQVSKKSEQRIKNVGLNPQYSFDKFVVGHNSEFAHAACQAVANGSGFSYNPLFIHGASGLGKTHLMQSIGNEILRKNPDAKVTYLTSEKFTNEFIDAVKKGNLDKFRKKYRRADVLLIDDIQFLAGKERSQEEFFHTFNTLLDLQSQIILTCDRPACEVKKFEPRMVSRFESGLTVELQVPMMETRLAILKRKMDDWQTKLPDDLVRFLADKIKSNIRRLEGALVRVATFASLGGKDITIERVEHLLKDILREEGSRKVTIDSIQKLVSEHFDINISDMTSRRRPANIAFARQVAMFLSRKLTQSSLMEIGDAFGGRDHGTVIHAVKKVEQRITKETSIRDTVDLLGAMLQRA